METCHQPGRLFGSWMACLLLAAAGMTGCNGPAVEKPTASRASRPSASSGGKASDYAPPIARQEPTAPAEKPETAAPANPSPENAAPESAPAASGERSGPGSPAALVAARPMEKAPAAANPAPPAAAPVANPAAPAAPPATQFGPPEPLDLIMPQVLMTDSEAQTCRVKVGDQLPDLRLPDLQGGEATLSSLYGKRLTIVLFWRATHPYDVEELGDLERLATRFANQQVRVVGIDVKDPPELVKETIAAKKVTYPILLDATGDALAKVATSLMPRSYLVDASGKILWFDMEYSRSTRRDLLRAIRATLTAGAAAN